MNKLIVEIEVDWGKNEFVIFHNEKDLKDFYYENGYDEVKIIDDQLILNNGGLKTYGKVNWGKQL